MSRLPRIHLLKMVAVEEGSCYDARWVLYVSDQSLNSALEASITLYVNQLGFKENFGKKWWR